jgi:hypothetical protein
MRVTSDMDVRRAVVVWRTEMIDEPRKPSLIGYLALFAGIYLVLMFVAGLAKLYLAVKTDLNAPVLIAAGVIISSIFTLRHRRLLTGGEVVRLSLGAFAIDVVLQLGITSLLTQDHAWLALWAIWFVLLLHLIGLFFIFGVLAKTIGKPVLEAMEKKTHNQAPQSTAGGRADVPPGRP